MAHRDAVDSLYNGSLTGKREQRTHTPPGILAAVADLWPEGIALDPAGSPEGLVRAARIVIPPENGLAIEWPERTYINPPFDDLKPWLTKFAASFEVLMLAPVRTHRKWFRVAMDACTDLVFLNPVAFVGFAQVFPAPLCLLYRGRRNLHLAAICRARGLA
jgi:hypothetical protein